jgi:hypothetical protein
VVNVSTVDHTETSVGTWVVYVIVTGIYVENVGLQTGTVVVKTTVVERAGIVITVV